MSISIHSEKLIFAEGKDDVSFFKELVDSIGIGNSVQIIDVEGKDRFRKVLESYTKQSGFRDVKSLIIARDADKNSQGAFDSVCSVLERLGLPIPSAPMKFVSREKLKVGILIIPPECRTGEIEDLFLSAVRGDGAMDCVDDYFKCLSTKITEGELPKKPSKARFYAFLASRKEFTQEIGVAIRKGYVSLEHAAFNKIKTFLKKL